MGLPFGLALYLICTFIPSLSRRRRRQRLNLDCLEAGLISVVSLHVYELHVALSCVNLNIIKIRLNAAMSGIHSRTNNEADSVQKPQIPPNIADVIQQAPPGVIRVNVIRGSLRSSLTNIDMAPKIKYYIHR